MNATQTSPNDEGGSAQLSWSCRTVRESASVFMSRYRCVRRWTPRTSPGRPGRECHHWKQWVDEAEAHDCSTTTEAALTRDLTDDLRDAWERIRETAVEFGEQRVYASPHSIMFSRKSCYFFVRAKKQFLE